MRRGDSYEVTVNWGYNDFVLSLNKTKFEYFFSNNFNYNNTRKTYIFITTPGASKEDLELYSISLVFILFYFI